jgi:iron complex outermembrane receptor protein
MVVEAERVAGVDPGQTSASVTVIAVDETLSAGADLGSVVESASGTVVRRLGGLGDYSSVSIRGSSSRQVQVYLDGIPLNPDGTESINLAELPLSAFERVEIYRGNAPPAFAAAPIGGVINLVSGEREVSSGALTYGQYNTARMSASAVQRGAVAGQDSDVLVLSEVFSTLGDFGYYTDNGTIYNTFDDARLLRENNDKSQLSSYGRWRLGSDSLRLVVADSFLAREEGLPGHSSAPAGNVRLDTVRNLATAQLEGGTQICWQGRLWQQSRHEEYVDLEGELGVGTQWQDSRYRTTGLLVHAAFAPLPWLVPSAVLTGRQDRYLVTDLLNDETEDPRLRYSLSGTLSADAWLRSERIRLTPVLQLSVLNNRLLGTVPFEEAAVAPDGEDTQLAFNPRLGVLGRPTDWLALKANGGSYLRPPDFTELFGDRGGIIGNTDLVPEEGWQWDAGLRLTAPVSALGTGSLDAAYFWTAAENQIIFVQNSQRTSIPRNFGETRVDGVEVAVALDLLGWVDSQSNLTWTRSENRTPADDVFGNQLPRLPEWEAYQGTSLRLKSWARLGHTFSYTADNYWDQTNFYLAAPRSIHGAFVRLSAGRISAEGSLLNLTNETVLAMDRNPLSDDDDTPILQPLTDFTGYPLPGRTWLFTLRWSGDPPGDEE